MSDKKREAFEAWAKDKFGWHDGRFEMYLGEYVNGKTFEKWQAWQAAIASVVVSIPEPELNGMLHPSDVKAAIEQAGAGYK